MIGLGSASQLGIGIAVSLQDRFSSHANKLNSQLRNLKQNTHSYITAAAQSYRNASLLVGYGALRMTQSMFGAAESGSQLVHRLRQIAIVGKDANLSYQGAAKLTKDLALKYAQTLPESQSAVFENVKAGIRDGLDYITDYQVAVSKATDEMLGGENGVAKGLLTIMNAYHLESNQFGRIANGVTAAANSSQSSVYSLTEAMKYSGHTFHELNIPLEESLALLARLSQAGIEGSAAGTAMQNALNEMSKAIGNFQTPRKRDALKMLGLSKQDFLDAKGELKPIIDIIRMVETRSAGMAGPERKSVLSALFNIRGERGLINLFGNFSNNPQQSIDYYLKQIKEGIRDDVSHKQATEMTQDLASDFTRLRVSMQLFTKTIAENPIFNMGIKALTGLFNAINWFAETGIGKVVVGIFAVVTPTIAAIALFRAATLTAALALRGMSASVGYGSLMRGVLGGMSTNPVARNINGRMIVAKGQTVNFGGKIYKGGQILPKGFTQGTGMILGQGIGSLIGSMFGGGMAGAGAAARNAGTVGKISSGIGGILGVASKFLPMLGTLGLIVTGISLLGNLLDDKREPLTSEEIAYGNFLSEMAYRRRMGPDIAGEYERTFGQKAINLNLTLNLDGQKSFDRKIQAKMDEMIHGSTLNVSY